jgi:hypothetical protein
MALQSFPSWQGEITEDWDFESGLVTLRARRKGTVLATNGESEEYVRTSGYMPRAGDSHPDNVVLLAKTPRVSRERGPWVFDWEVDYEWRSPEPPTGTIQWPTGVPAFWTVEETTEVSTHPIDQDYFGDPIRTVTRESPDPPLTEEIYETRWTYSRGGRPYNHTLFDMYRGVVNSDVWLGRPAGSCKIIDISASLTLRTDGPPETRISVVVVKGKPPPALQFTPTGSASAEEKTNGRAYYTWSKRWRAEGFYVIKDTPNFTGTNAPRYVRAIDQHGIETVKPVLHGRSNAREITDPALAEWYLTDTKPRLPFGTFFNSA